MDFKKGKKNALIIAKRDFKALTTNKIVMLTLIAIIILPSLYSLLNIAACWDPYDSTSNLQFAIVNEDNGADYNGKYLNFGNELVDSLKNNTKFDWKFVTNENADQGIANGTYVAEIIIPANFTESILSINSPTPTSGELQYIVNQKTNPVSSRMCDSAIKTISAELNSKIVSTVDLEAFDKAGTLQSGLSSGAGQLSSGAGQLSAGANQVSSGATKVSNGANQINSGAEQIETGAVAIEIGAVIIEKIYGNNSASELARASGALAGKSAELAYGSSELASGSNDVASGSTYLAFSAANALATASSSLASASAALDVIAGINEDDLGNYFASPIEINKTVLNEVDTYGSEVSPFYLVLSIWVGCIITAVMVRSRYLNPKFSPLELYFGKMSLFMGLGILQTTVTIIGSFLLGIQIGNIPLFIFSMYLITLVFMLFVYSCISVFGNVGKGIVIVLLVLQISSTGGIYPVEVMAPFFQFISPFMPMTYAITMIREASLGLYLPNYLFAFTIIVAMGIATFILAVIIKDRYDKKANYFERCLEDSGLF